MSKPVLQFDNGETWARLWGEIQTCRNVAYVAKGQMPDHLHARLDMAAEKAQRILRDEVVVENDELDRAKDANGESMKVRIDAMFDKHGEVIMEDEEPRGHTNLEFERGMATWAPDRDQLAYDKMKEEEKA